MLSEEAYSSLRHYETIVLVDSRSAVKKHRVLALSEDRIHILIHKNYRKEIDAPWLLKEITRIARTEMLRNLYFLGTQSIAGLLKELRAIFTTTR